MKLSDYAAWWGATVATIVLVWDIIKWRSRGPRLRTRITQDFNTGDSEFKIYICNTGDMPATIESVELLCFYRSFIFSRRPVDLKHSFGMFGNNGFPPLTLQPGEPWAVSIGLLHQVPELPPRRLEIAIEIQESHRNKPYRYFTDATRFNRFAKTRTPPCT